jgi:hypothetical protein
MISKSTPVPEQKYSFLCTKCGSNECEKGDEAKQHPRCGKCSYLGFGFPDNYTKEDMEAYGRAEYIRAVDDAIEMVCFHGGTVHLEAHIRALKDSE